MEEIPTETIHGNLATLKSVEAIMEETDRAIVPVVGDCLEGAGVQDGGRVAVAFDRYPPPPRHKSRGGDGSVDLCLCYATFPGTRKSMWDGDRFRPNCGIFAERIFGVIFASWDKDGNLLWERDLNSFPATLGCTPTIHGEVEPA